MKPAFFYDTETTGLPLFKEPSEDPRQPHIVQAAGILADLDTRQIITSFDLIAKPEGWTIPDEVAAIHGITNEKAAEVGIDEGMIVFLLNKMASMASVRIGHNESFDARIVRIGLMRFGPQGEADIWKERKAECTATMSTDIVKCPPTDKMKAVGRNHYKKPNLSEAYKHFTSKDLVGAHSAMADTRACMEIYFAIMGAA